MSSDKTKGGVDDDLKAYERKLPAESAVTTEHTVSYYKHMFSQTHVGFQGRAEPSCV